MKNLIVLTYNMKYNLVIIILLFFTNNFDKLNAQSVTTCPDNLEQAEEAYYDEEYSKSISLVSQCLKQSDISDELRAQSYKILSRTFLAMENSEKAKEFVKKILVIEPNYLPTIEQETPKYVNLVIQVRKENEQIVKEESSGISQWIWIGAGSAVAITTAIVIISNGDDKKDKENNALPLPPEFP